MYSYNIYIAKMRKSVLEKKESTVLLPHPHFQLCILIVVFLLLLLRIGNRLEKVLQRESTPRPSPPRNRPCLALLHEYDKDSGHDNEEKEEKILCEKGR